MTALSASRPSFTKPTSLPLLSAGLLSAIKVFVRHLSGLHGEMCYVLLRDHFSNTLHDAAPRSKAPPIGWLTKWLVTKGAGPTVDSKYVLVDLGGELGRYQADGSQLVPSECARREPPSRHQKVDQCHALGCLLGISFLAVCVLSFPPTSQHDHSLRSDEDSVRTLLWS
jgi:hypothetical protein